jgi:hypothetical protein
MIGQMLSSYRRGVAIAVFVFVLTVSPYAHAAETTALGINDPFADALQLWSAVLSSIDSLANQIASALQLHQALTFNTTPKPHAPKNLQQPAALAASAALATQSPPETATTSGSSAIVSVPPQQPQTTGPPEAISDQTTQSPFVKSADFSPNSPAFSQPAASNPALAAAPPSAFVTQAQFNAGMSVLGSSVQQLLAKTDPHPFPESVGADGNNLNPYAAASNIGQLSNVTITNPTITGLSAGEIPNLSGTYLSLGGGTLTGAFADSGTASSSFAGALGIGTTSPSDVLAVSGPIFLGSVSPAATGDRLYNNGGSLYWNGSLVGGGPIGSWLTDGTSVWRTAGDVGIGTTSPISELDVEGWTVTSGDCSNADCSTGNPQVNLSGTLNTALTSPGHVTGFQGIWQTVGATSSTSNINGMRLQLDAGYTGDATDRVADFQNYIQGTHLLGVQNVGGNIGATIEAQGGATNDSTTGDNVGVYAIANGSDDLNVAVFGRSIDQSSGSNGSLADVGVIGIGAHNVGHGTFSQIGAYFTPYPSINYSAFATTSTALLLDNQASGFPLLFGDVNSVNAFTLTATGGITSTSTTNSTNFWQVLNSSGSSVLDIDTSNQRVGIGTTTPGSLLSVQGVANFTPATSTLYSTGGLNLTGGGCFAVNGTCIGGGAASSQWTTAGSNISYTGGNVGIGTTSPYAALAVWGADTSVKTLPFQVVSSASTTLFAVTDGGNVGIGTTSPADNFVVTNPNSTASLSIRSAGAGVGSGNVKFTMQNGDGNTYAWQYSGSGNTLLKLQYNGASQDSFNSIGALVLGYNAGARTGTILDAEGLGYFGSSTSPANTNLIGLYGGGVNYGLVANSAQNVWNLGYASSLTTLATPVLTWNSSGNVGLGTTSPYAALAVWGADTSAGTSAFVISNSASTTEFNVLDNGNATLAGTLTQNSDQRLKTNIQSLNASSSLAAIDELNPVTFNWLDLSQGSTTQLGFIAQQVQPIFPNLVSTTSSTALTPNGTLSLNYIGLISPIVSAIQALSNELASIENAIAGFAQSFTTAILHAQEADVQKLCVGSTCVTPAQFQAMVAAANQSGSSSTPPPTSSDGAAASSSADSSATPPVLQVNGDNPAIIQVGATYTDLGATITGPQADLNLGITTYVNGAPMNPVQIDTSTAATDTIAYVATDSAGLTSTSTRTVIVEAPSIVPRDDASSTTTDTSATSTSQ